MRLFPILTAIVVTIFLYFVIFDRDALQRGASDIRELAPVLTETLTSDESEVSAEPDNALPTTDTSAPVSVVVLQSKAQPVQSGIILRGRTEAARRVDVRAETSGKIISEPIRKGAAVVAGQALCEIDPGTRAAQRAEAVARLREAELNAANTTELAEKGFAPETALISAQAALEAAQARIQQIDADIAHLTVTAPFDGMLESDTAELGSLISQGGLCATVIDLSTVKMVGFVPEAQIGLIADNALAGGRLISGREIMGNVTFLSRSADPVTRTFRAEITVDNTDLSIRDGETVEIGIALDSVL
ncbi:MAG TPA: efflux RND transporter periplasmic adaptor subunit, partial [Paracoccaceae bacterium]|nr:efflux RND transporter periplasmic adaptor subunit [Paracoccaceae bacterium]